MPCDPRIYSPAICGVFKVRMSDGDLVWESTPAVPNSSPTESLVLPQIDDRLVVQGRQGAFARAMSITQNGDGEINSIERTDTPSLPPLQTVSVGDQRLLPMDYTTTTTWSTSFRSISPSQAAAYVFKNNAAGEHVGTAGYNMRPADIGSPCRAFGNSVDVFMGTGYFIRDFPGTITPLTGIYRLTDTGTPDAPASYARSAPDPIDVTPPVPYVRCECMWDRWHRIPSDGTHYYMGAINLFAFPPHDPPQRLRKILISDLSIVDQTPFFGGTFSECAISGGSLLVSSLFGFSPVLRLFSTSPLTQQWSVSTGRTILRLDISNGMAVTTEASPFASPNAVFVVARDAGTGATLWTRTIEHRGSPTSLNRWEYPLVSISGSRVLVGGALIRNGTSMQLFCLDSSDGSILWSFASNQATQSASLGPAVAGHVASIVDAGDHVYIGTGQCNAPTYR